MGPELLRVALEAQNVKQRIVDLCSDSLLLSVVRVRKSCILQIP